MQQCMGPSSLFLDSSIYVQSQPNNNTSLSATPRAKPFSILIHEHTNKLTVNFIIHLNAEIISGIEVMKIIFLSITKIMSWRTYLAKTCGPGIIY